MEGGTVVESGASLLGQSAAIERVRREAVRAARTHAKVLITGETGSGKEVVARIVHESSPRAVKRLVALNCSGVPETLLESELFGHVRGSFTGAHRDKPGLIRVAEGGTLFLDELGEMSLRMQAALLRFAETGEVQPVGSEAPVARADVRIIAATHRDLREHIAQGTFRQDLYYRLNVIHIFIPALRERPEDVPVLLDHFLTAASEQHQAPRPILNAEAERRLLTYHWPGNVRELKNVAERLVVGGARVIRVDDLPHELVDRRFVAPARTLAPGGDERQPADAVRSSADVDDLWRQIQAGASFWAIVHRPFRAHDLTRDHVRAVIDRGLRQTRGNYREVARLLNMPDADYKRFMAFLAQHECNQPFRPHRNGLRVVDRACA